jgi:hypothetical protein
VHYINYGITANTWWALWTPAGGDVIGSDFTP